MSTRGFRTLGALGLACATGLTLVGCGAVLDASGGEAQGSDVTACLVSDDGGFQDHSFNQSSYEGLTAAAEHTGIRTGRAESQSATDFEPNLASMVQQGCTLTVAAGSLLAASTQKAAAANPDRYFALVDDSSVRADNVKPIVYETAEAAFLAGYLAAGSSRTGKVATYGGRDIPAVTVSMDGFADGVKHYNEKNKKDVEVLGWDRGSQEGTFLSSFQDSSRSTTVTQNLIRDGADVVFPVAGQAAQGAADAVTAANEDGKNIRLIWPDVDGYEALESGRQYLLTSVLKNMSRSVEEVVTQAADGTFDSAPYVGTLENGGVGLAPYHDQQSTVDGTLDRQVRQLEKDIVDRSVRVPATSTPTP